MIGRCLATLILSLSFCATAVFASDDPDYWSSAVSNALTTYDKAPKPHPRLFGGQTDYAGIVAAAKGERSAGFNNLTSYLRRTSMQVPNQSNKQVPGTLATKQSLDDWFKFERSLEGITESAFAWHVTRDDWYLREVRARLTSFSAIPIGNECKMETTQSRAFAWHFALAFDLAYSGLNAAERDVLKSVIKACVSAVLPTVINAVRTNPRDSIAFHTLGRLSGVLAIMLGEFPEARTWLEPALKLYIKELSPWGGADGGYSNGSSYLLWDVGESLLSWDVLQRTLGLPVYSKPWVAAIPKFMAYVLPPGTPAGTFGDGAEVNRKEEWARFGKAIAARSNTPLARWYERQLFGEDTSRLHVLLSPSAAAGNFQWPTGEPDSAHFPSVGIAALHSAMADRSRISIYFKSSPYGSHNHSHADQNSFLIYARGQVLAMDSGYYDRYNSPHWRDWYKQTKAHNAITFDGGEGQSLGILGTGAADKNGRISDFHSAPDHDLVAGDATAAYGGKLKSARRWLVFIKPSTLIVIDRLEAASARKWEWNLHSPEPLQDTGKGYRIPASGTEMCMNLWPGSEASLTTRSGYPVKPELSGASAPHFWSSFAYREASQVGTFVAVLRFDCSTSEPEVSISGGTTVVKIGNKTVTHAGTKVSVN